MVKNTPNIRSIGYWVDSILIMNVKLTIWCREQDFTGQMWLSSHSEMTPTTHWKR